MSARLRKEYLMAYKQSSLLRKLRFVITTLILVSFASFAGVNAQEDGSVVTSCSLCPICCVTSTGSSGSPTYTCSSNELTCKLNPRTDFSILLTTLLIILGFAIGIPMLIYIIDFLVIRRPCNSKMSVCEFCVNYLCLCICCKKNRGADRANQDTALHGTNLAQSENSPRKNPKQPKGSLSDLAIKVGPDHEIEKL